MALAQAFQLASNLGVVTGPSVEWPGGDGLLTVEGTTPAAQLQIQSANGTWLPLGTALAAAGTLNFKAPPSPVRLNITGGSAVFAYVLTIPQPVGFAN